MSGLGDSSEGCKKLYYTARYENIIFRFYYFTEDASNLISSDDFYNIYLKDVRKNFEKQLFE